MLFLSGSGVVYISTVLMLLLQFMCTVLLSHRLGDQGIGAVSFVLRLVSVPVALVGLGLPTIVSRYVASRVEDDHSSVMASSVVPPMFLSAVVIAAIWITAEPIAMQTGDLGLGPLIVLGSFIVPLGATSAIAMSFVRGRMQFKKYGGLLLVAPVTNLLVIVLMYDALTPLTAIAASLVASAAAVVVSIANTPKVAWGLPSRAITSQLLISGIPLLLANLAGSLLDSTGTIVLGVLTNDMSIVGAYSNAFVVASLIRYLAEPLSVILLPISAAAFASSATSELRVVVSTALKVITVVYVPFCLIVSVTSGEVLTILFPIEFVIGAPVLTILSLFSPAIAIHFLFWRLLVANGNTFAAGAVYVVASVLNIPLCVLMTHYLGIIGPALSTGTTFLTMAIGSAELVRRKVGIRVDPSLSRIIGAIVFLVMTTLWHRAVIFLLGQIEIRSDILVICVVGAGALLAQAILKPISSSDRNFVMRMMDGFPGPVKRLMELLMAPFTSRAGQRNRT
ncbi:MAG: oligosaccharide flippase family protein [Candidatus Thorarchaeota archaeon]